MTGFLYWRPFPTNVFSSIPFSTNICHKRWFISRNDNKVTRHSITTFDSSYKSNFVSKKFPMFNHRRTEKLDFINLNISPLVLFICSLMNIHYYSFRSVRHDIGMIKIVIFTIDKDSDNLRRFVLSFAYFSLFDFWIFCFAHRRIPLHFVSLLFTQHWVRS